MQNCMLADSFLGLVCFLGYACPTGVPLVFKNQLCVPEKTQPGVASSSSSGRCTFNPPSQ